MYTPNGAHIERIATSLHSSNKNGAKIDITIKDHKNKDENDDYKTRPLSNCKGSISECISLFLTKIIDNICEDADESMIKSTEEMMAIMTDFNEKQRNENETTNNEKIVFLSMDVTGLYIEVKPEKVGEEVREAVVNSDWNIEVDIEEATKYIAVNLTRSSISKFNLLDVIPARKYMRGKHPTVTGQEMKRRPCLLYTSPSPRD